jgi:hypothetical protein
LTKKYIALLLLIVVGGILVAGCTTSPAATPGTGTTVKPTQAPATSGIKYATVWPTLSNPATGTGELYGTITKEGSDNVPLQNAVIYLWKEENAYDEKTVPAFAKGVTDAKGEYRISKLPFGYYKIRVTAPDKLGYHDSDIVNIDGSIKWDNAE